MTRQEVQTELAQLKDMHVMFLKWFDREYSDNATCTLREMARDISDMFYDKQSTITAALIEQTTDEIYLLDI